MNEVNSELTQAVRELNTSVSQLRQVLQDDYPKRTEIERRFISKLEQRKHLTRMTFVALVTVAGCYVTSTGAYAVCFVGDENPDICSVVPGYEDRLDRRDELNKQIQELQTKVRRLERGPR